MDENFLRFFQNEKKEEPTSTYLHLFILLEQIDAENKTTSEVEESSHDIKIELAPPNQRVRKVVRRSNYRMTGKFPSRKNGRMMHWESHYELAAFRLLEIYPGVFRYCEQPAVIRYNNCDNIAHLHYPDILVILKSGIKIFIEVKPNDAQDDALLEKRTRYLEVHLKQLGYHYLMVTAEQLQSEAYLENAKLLLQYSRPSFPETIVEEVRRIFANNQSLTIQQLQLLLNHSNSKAWIYRLLIEGILNGDLSKPLTLDTTIHWHRQEAA